MVEVRINDLVALGSLLETGAQREREMVDILPQLHALYSCYCLFVCLFVCLFILPSLQAAGLEELFDNNNRPIVCIFQCCVIFTRGRACCSSSVLSSRVHVVAAQFCPHVCML